MFPKKKQLLVYVSGLCTITAFIFLKLNIFQVQAQSINANFILPNSNSNLIIEDSISVGYQNPILDSQISLQHSWFFIRDKISREFSFELEKIIKEEKKNQERLQQATKTEQKKTKTLNLQPVKVMGDFETAIRSACNTYGCNSEQLIRVMYCESGGRSNAVNRIHSGLFQFNPKTFQANAKRIGLVNADIWNPYHQIQVAAWMFANGQAWQWTCK